MVKGNIYPQEVRVLSVPIRDELVSSLNTLYLSYMDGKKYVV